VVTASHGLTKDGQRYFGLFQVGHPSDDFGLVVGVRNSHDKTFPAALALGATVFVCDNLSFSGEVKLARKHTTYIERDLPLLVTRAIGRLTDLRSTQEQRFIAYKEKPLTDSQVNDVVIQALDARVLPVTRIPDVLQEWRHPAHEEFADKTAWRLFNGFTEVLKGNLDLRQHEARPCTASSMLPVVWSSRLTKRFWLRLAKLAPQRRETVSRRLSVCARLEDTMDPTRNLAEQLRLAKTILGRLPFLDGDGERLAELVVALDEWLRNSGALPEPWKTRKRKAKGAK
jgi:hypothetical protein